jgi:hypothetical protein
VISALVVKCKRCRLPGNWTSRSDRITVRSMAAADGWHEVAAGWLCPEHYRAEHGLEEMPAEPVNKELILTT